MSINKIIKKNYTIIKNNEDFQNAINHIKVSEYLAYDTETTGLNVRKDKVIGFSFSGSHGIGYYFPIYEYDTINKELIKLPIATEYNISKILNTLKDKDLLMWNASFDIRITKNSLGVDLIDSLSADIMLLKHTLLEEGEFSLKGVAKQFQKEIGLDIETEANEEQIILKDSIIKNGGSATKTNYELYKADLDIIGKYACADTDLTLRLGDMFLSMLQKEGLESFFFDEEVMPLYKTVTINMEEKGIELDIPLMVSTKLNITQDLIELNTKILDSMFCSDKVEQWYIEQLNIKYPATNKGEFAQKICELYELDLPKTKVGKFSITKSSIATLPDNNIKNFLLTGNKHYLDNEVDIIQIQHDIHIKKEGREVNILSKKQLKEIAFEVLGYKPTSKTDKGQDQFDDNTIQSLEEQGVTWAAHLGDFNKLTKIKSTYIDRFLEIQEKGIFYPSFQQHRTISGRYGSDMQQLSRPKEEGQLRPTVLNYNNMIRQFFIAGKGRKFIDNDYESLEPHVFAHVSGDEGLRDIFRKGHDFYSTIAIKTEKLYEYSADKKADNYLGKLNKAKRQSAKAYSLGVPYGMTSYALSKTLGVSQEEGESLVNGYLDAFPNLKKWMKDSERQAKILGYVKTETGRIRHLPKVKEIYEKFGDDLLDHKKRRSYMKKYGEDKIIEMYRDYKNGLNNAKNFQIQGLSASIVNRAAIAINKKFKEENIDGWVALQIHDQLVMNVLEEDAERASKLVQEIMENNYKISLALKAIPQISDNLKDGH